MTVYISYKFTEFCAKLLADNYNSIAVGVFALIFGEGGGDVWLVARGGAYWK
jgi:hypothetical protein